MTGPGFLLRLAGALQSYGNAAAFHQVRDTGPFPTRSALIGMFAAAQGTPRDQPLDPAYTSLTITVRIDRPGTTHTDFHTVGRAEHSVPTSSGRTREPDKRTLTSHRAYLADAVFTAAVQGPPELTARITDALHTPTTP
ncbi:type I-E CRISPR-associated protein Cas5/CasD [Kitasatospora sp. Ki12]